MSVIVESLGLQIGNINPSPRQSQLDSGVFAAALGKAQPPITENPQTQQTIKYEQPTQREKSKPNTAPSEHASAEPQQADDEAIVSDAQPDEAMAAVDVADNAATLIAAATLLTDIPLAEIATAETVNSKQEISATEEPAELHLQSAVVAIDSTPIEIIKPESKLESTHAAELPKAQMAFSQDSDDTIAVKEKSEFPEDAIVSSEVHQLQPIETPLAQKVDESEITEQKTTGENKEASETQVVSSSPEAEKATVVEGDSPVMQDISSKPVEVAPQTMQQQAVASASLEAKAPDARSNKTNSENDISRKELSSIVESIKVESVSDKHSNSEMSLELNNKESDNPLQSSKFEETLQDFKPIEHTDITSITKPLDSTKAIDTEMIIDQPDKIRSISDQIKTAAQNLSAVNGKRITITLTPESLGRVEIEVHVQAGRISAIEIKASKLETLQLLETNAKMLQETLKQVSSGNEANLGFGFLDKGNDGSNQKQEATAPTQEFSLLKSNAIDDVAKRTLSDFSN